MLATQRLPSVHDLADSARNLSRRAPRPSWLRASPRRSFGWARGTALLGLGMVLGAGLVLLLDSRPPPSSRQRSAEEDRGPRSNGAPART